MRTGALIGVVLCLCANLAWADPKIIDIPDDEDVPVLPAAAAPATAAASTAAKTEVEPTPAPEAPAPEYTHVVLQGLNKVTGHISKIEGQVGNSLSFGSLQIIARRCWKSEPEDRPENAALLEIYEVKPEGPQQIFLGWMFSSSPGISGIEHPVYDINVLSCELAPAPAKPEKKDDKKDASAKKSKK